MNKKIRTYFFKHIAFALVLLFISFNKLSAYASNICMIDNTIILKKGCSYKLDVPDKYRKNIHYTFSNGKSNVLIKGTKIYGKKCGTTKFTVFYKKWHKSFKLRIVKDIPDITNNIMKYPYMKIDTKLSPNEKYLLYLNWNLLEPEIKSALFNNNVKIIISSKIFETQYKDECVVGLYDANDYTIYLDSSMEGVDSFLHEVGHFWSDINGNLSNTVLQSYIKNPDAYNNYAPDDIDEFYASKFKEDHIRIPKIQAFRKILFN